MSFGEMELIIRSAVFLPSNMMSVKTFIVRHSYSIAKIEICISQWTLVHAHAKRIENTPITPAERVGLQHAAELGSSGRTYALLHTARPSTTSFSFTSWPLALLSCMCKNSSSGNGISKRQFCCGRAIWGAACRLEEVCRIRMEIIGLILYFPWLYDEKQRSHIN